MRNIILVTALFLAAGIVSAAPTYSAGNLADGNVIVNLFNETSNYQTIVYDAKTNYWKASDDSYKANIDIEVKGPKTGLKYDLYKTDGTWIKELEVGTQRVELETLSQKPGNGVYTYAIKVTDMDTVAKLSYHSYLDGFQQSFVYDGKGTVYFGSNQSGTQKNAQFTFGSPLPTPVATLLIALGFGAAFVMYRKNKQAKA